jgi:hypothetical protein
MQVTVEPLAAADNYVNAMWGFAAIDQKMECPAETRVALTPLPDDDTFVSAAIAAALNAHIYGTTVAGATVTTFELAAGTALVKRGVTTILTYAVTEVSPRGCGQG